MSRGGPASVGIQQGGRPRTASESSNGRQQQQNYGHSPAGQPQQFNGQSQQQFNSPVQHGRRPSDQSPQPTNPTQYIRRPSDNGSDLMSPTTSSSGSAGNKLDALMQMFEQVSEDDEEPEYAAIPSHARPPQPQQSPLKPIPQQQSASSKPMAQPFQNITTAQSPPASSPPGTDRTKEREQRRAERQRKRASQISSPSPTTPNTPPPPQPPPPASSAKRTSLLRPNPPRNLPIRNDQMLFSPTSAKSDPDTEEETYDSYDYLDSYRTSRMSMLPPVVDNVVEDDIHRRDTVRDTVLDVPRVLSKPGTPTSSNPQTEALKEEINALKAEMTPLQRDLEVSKTTTTNLEKALTQTENSLNAVTQDLDATKDELKGLHVALETSRAETEKHRHDVRKLQSELEMERDTLLSLEAEIEGLRADRDMGVSDFEAERSATAERIRGLEEKLRNAIGERDEALRRCEGLQGEVVRLMEEISVRVAERDAAEEEAEGVAEERIG
ncbi:hypothetical protein BC829DRAFT_207577 [Chytridium lagenaria]|nr:hypothetical protein BC829DRAFT_207577 [Chytridium lagenaria]